MQPYRSSTTLLILGIRPICRKVFRSPRAARVIAGLPPPPERPATCVQRVSRPRRNGRPPVFGTGLPTPPERPTTCVRRGSPAPAGTADHLCSAGLPTPPERPTGGLLFGLAPETSVRTGAGSGDPRTTGSGGDLRSGLVRGRATAHNGERRRPSVRTGAGSGDPRTTGERRRPSVRTGAGSGDPRTTGSGGDLRSGLVRGRETRAQRGAAETSVRTGAGSGDPRTTGSGGDLRSGLVRGRGTAHNGERRRPRSGLVRGGNPRTTGAESGDPPPRTPVHRRAYSYRSPTGAGAHVARAHGLTISTGRARLSDRGARAKVRTFTNPLAGAVFRTCPSIPAARRSDDGCPGPCPAKCLPSKPATGGSAPPFPCRNRCRSSRGCASFEPVSMSGQPPVALGPGRGRAGLRPLGQHAGWTGPPACWSPTPATATRRSVRRSSTRSTTACCTTTASLPSCGPSWSANWRRSLRSH